MIRGIGGYVLSTYSQTIIGYVVRISSLDFDLHCIHLVGLFWYSELAMRDAPNVGLRRQTARSSDTTKGVGPSRQQDGGHGSRNPLRSV
jgi:hypothetical protein